MLQAIALRLRTSLGVALSRAFPRPPMATPAFALAGLNGLQNWPLNERVEDEEVQEEEDFSILKMAVPKRRVSHRRKRIKYDQKHLEPIQSLVSCKSCGQKHPQYYQLCPFCQPFNNFIKTKDVPAREVNRVHMKMAERLFEEKLKQKKTQDLDTKSSTKEIEVQGKVSGEADDASSKGGRKA